MKKDGMNIAIAVIILFVVVAFLFAVYFTFQPTRCERYECFQDHMASCSRASFVNEEPEASWGYDIVSRYRENCEIKITLLQAKEGDLKLRAFEGHEMRCNYALGVIAYPDKDLSLCTGLLKEDLQGLVIEKLHTYIIGNLKNIQDGFASANVSTNVTI